MARPKRQGPRRREAVAVLSGEMLMTLLHGRGFFEALTPSWSKTPETSMANGSPKPWRRPA